MSVSTMPRCVMRKRPLSCELALGTGGTVSLMQGKELRLGGSLLGPDLSGWLQLQEL